jgi:hypothetical protein
MIPKNTVNIFLKTSEDKKMVVNNSGIKYRDVKG